MKILLVEKNPLFESLIGKLTDYPELRKILFALLFQGRTFVYNPDDESVDIAFMFGFVKNDNGNVVIANRIFETRLYNWFLSFGAAQNTEIYSAGIQEKNQFIQDGHLNMERTDVIVDYHGEQFVIELKIWRGNAYHLRGEEQLRAYLDYYHLQKGYMLSFNFNEKKETGVKHIALGNKTLIEAVV